MCSKQNRTTIESWKNYNGRRNRTRYWIHFPWVRKSNCFYCSCLFRGTSGIDIDLRRVDIDQCPQRKTPGKTVPLNIFAGTDKCKQRTTMVSFYWTLIFILCNLIVVGGRVLDRFCATLKFRLLDVWDLALDRCWAVFQLFPQVFRCNFITEERSRFHDKNQLNQF